MIMGFLKKCLTILTYLGGIVALFVGGFELRDYLTKDEPAEHSVGIPLTYQEVVEFRAFLDKNSGKKVRLNSEIVFDSALQISKLIHEVCDYSDFLDAVMNSPNDVSNIDLGIVKFHDDFEAPLENNAPEGSIGQHYIRGGTYRGISCFDKIRIKVKDPSQLRLGFGGTNTMSLPIYGEFLIEKRYFAGPSTEYTLREL
ncbi:hypothetical protein [Microbulbifer sp. JMSA002]|uniref:hypothetical protein n=1 Tax=Microbulbifer sp. JMSA002 TaxID=3243368 RepID=UPI00403A71B8